MRIGIYRNADRLLNKLPEVKLPGEETFLREIDGDSEEPDIAVRYRQTNVLIFKPNGDIVYNHGGWTTGTTAKRMAGYGPERVEIVYEGGKLALRVDDIRYEFGDEWALVVHANGKVQPYDGELG
jgi:hypothetical protein